MKDLASLISSFASLAWPIVVFVALVWFRSEIRGVLGRLRKGKVLGTEFELDQLQAKTEVAEAKTPAVVTLAGEGKVHVTATVVRASEREVEEVLREAARSPRLGLMLLSAKIERAAREKVEEANLNMRAGPGSLRDLIEALVHTKQLPKEAGEALELFNRVRNRIIHGHDADDDEITRAIDSGTRLLRLLLSRPRSPEDGKPEN